MATKLNLENIQSVDKQDIIELDRKITDVRLGRIDEERFKHYRLTRGVYGQRQVGVQMFRTKIPFGRLTTEQLEALAQASIQYSTGNLHLTTRQNIQLHYVKLGDSPHLWADLSRAGVTAMGACGNTVRNITASAKAGIHPEELFDVSPYVQAMFEYFLRNPICQEMGRKIKIAFSATDEDSAFAYFHDFGFIPRLKEGKRGFKVLLGGGLGAQAMVAPTVYEFLEEERIIPFVEAAIRVFDRYGEREKRMKARMKFLLKKWGVAHFLSLVEKEYPSLEQLTVHIDTTGNWQPTPPASDLDHKEPTIANVTSYKLWQLTNTFEQKQAGYYAVLLKIRLGDISASSALKLAAIIRQYAANELRLTVNQGILIKYVPKASLAALYNALDELGLADAGFGAIVDITACPGTDTCNLGVSNSTALAKQLENVLLENYAHLIGEKAIQIKISGCMNACGQHMAANIGFHGSSIKVGKEVLPAMQVVLGGGVDEKGNGFIAEKIIKLPSKRIPTALVWLLDDYEEKELGGEYFNDYVKRQGKRYFYNLLKALAIKDNLHPSDFWDWGQEKPYQKEIGVGECAGVAFDMVATIINDAKEKIQLSNQALKENLWGDSIYLSYGAFVIAAKAVLLGVDIKCNTQIGIINDFDKELIETGKFDLDGNFAELVLQINKNTPEEVFAVTYWQQAAAFLEQVIEYRRKELDGSKRVLSEHYKA
ncbi:nitrite/sulfite reductase [Aureispira anguillae]|uniref:Nitrite/sulfite reductase n=1 Tax=Aureispira anguillae TaxID=2864201 RepID=A0A915YII1_9BACT|nr:nitrite/sulfite reductase [Aureispira anguillae]BDS13799.1 nitrite/sulfite reductase [Aureispira anguillae]